MILVYQKIGLMICERRHDKDEWSFHELFEEIDREKAELKAEERRSKGKEVKIGTYTQQIEVEE